MHEDVTPAADAVLPMLRACVEGPYGIAIGGAHAKGAADPRSDLDLYVFYSIVRPDDERTRLARECAPTVRDVVSWSAVAPYEQAGTDFYLDDLKVECWFRSADGIERTIRECRAGVVRRELVTWTPNGFYNHCCLSDLHVMRPIDDPLGLLAGWKRSIAAYPPKLQAAIIELHLQAARFWPHNFHYSSAVERADVLYTTAIVQQVVHNLIQVLFAANETYFPGDKKLAAALGHLADIPDRFGERAEALLFPLAAPEAAVLRSQQVSCKRFSRKWKRWQSAAAVRAPRDGISGEVAAGLLPGGDSRCSCSRRWRCWPPLRPPDRLAPGTAARQAAPSGSRRPLR